MNVRDVAQFFSLIIGLLALVIRIILTIRRRKHWRLLFPWLLWAVHSAAFYSMLWFSRYDLLPFAVTKLFMNWSPYLTLHALVTLFVTDVVDFFYRSVYERDEEVADRYAS